MDVSNGKRGSGAGNAESWEFLSGLQEGEGWEELEERALNPADWSRLESSVEERIARFETRSTYRVALLGLVLWHHHEKVGAAPTPAVAARLLLGLYGLRQEGRVLDALRRVCEPYDRRSLYLDVIRDLDDADAESSDYFYESLFVSRVSIHEVASL